LLDEYRFPPDRVSASFRKKWKMASMPFPWKTSSFLTPSRIVFRHFWTPSRNSSKSGDRRWKSVLTFTFFTLMRVN
jgi:hypothetical protein